MSRYPTETLDKYEDDGVMPANVETLSKEVVGHRIVSAQQEPVPHPYLKNVMSSAFVITLDNGKKVALRDTSDCCAYTSVEGFFLDPTAVDHVIMGIGTTEQYTTWHIYADYGDILKLDVAWSCGNPFYYGYGFDIEVVELP